MAEVWALGSSSRSHLFSKVLTHVGFVVHAPNKPPLTSNLLSWGESLMPLALKPQTSCLCTSSSAAQAWELPGLWLGEIIYCHSRANRCKESADISLHRDHCHHSPVVPLAMLFPLPSGSPHKRYRDFLMCVAAAQ